MGKETGISWCDHTYNSWWGCAKISAGCKHCYADTFQSRYGYDVFGFNADGSRKMLRTFGEKHWNEPLRWEADAVKAGVRRRVFCASMADVFDDHPDAPPLRERLWALIRATPHLDWQLLTKRPENILRMLPADWDGGYPNVWLGTSVEAGHAASRVQVLCAVPARVRFLSCEPLIGPLHFIPEDLAGIDWAIIGGESGSGARRMDPEWVDGLLGDFDQGHVTPFVKQMGSVLARQMNLTHSKGEDPAEWPARWQRQEFPVVPAGDTTP